MATAMIVAAWIPVYTRAAPSLAVVRSLFRKKTNVNEAIEQSHNSVHVPND